MVLRAGGRAQVGGQRQAVFLGARSGEAARGRKASSRHDSQGSVNVYSLPLCLFPVSSFPFPHCPLLATDFIGLERNYAARILQSTLAFRPECFQILQVCLFLVSLFEGSDPKTNVHP